MYRWIIQSRDVKTKTKFQAADLSGSDHSADDRQRLTTLSHTKLMPRMILDSRNHGHCLVKTQHSKKEDAPTVPMQRSLSDGSLSIFSTSTASETPSLRWIVSSTGGTSNDSMDLTLFIDDDDDDDDNDNDNDMDYDDQSSTTELCPIFKIYSSVNSNSNAPLFSIDKRYPNDRQDAVTSHGTDRRSKLRRVHSSGLDAYLEPPPRFTRFEI